MNADAVVIGSGFSGLAAAEALLRHGVKSVAVIERERVPGQHASGQNAGMIRQAGVAEDIQPILVQGAEALREIFKGSVSFQQTGSLLLAGAKEVAHFVESGRRVGLPVVRESRAEAIRRVPILEQASFEEALWCPTDGVLDIHALLSYLMERVKALGGSLHMDQCATGFEKSGLVISAVTTTHGTIATNMVVNASGAWAGEVGNLAGAVPITFQPFRRHLMFTGPLSWVNPTWPFVWDVAHAYYFRPETGGLLLSPCDEGPVLPGVPGMDMSVLADFAGRLKSVCPPLAGLPVHSAWAGLRTFTEDRKFVVGPDTQVKNFYWLAGQGGHGVTACLALGEWLAKIVMGRAITEESVSWNPSRFFKQPRSLN